MSEPSRLPQINWRGGILDMGRLKAVDGELRVGTRAIRCGALVKDDTSVLEAAEMIEAYLWRSNYRETLRDIRQRNDMALLPK
jgi:hypothetical protein